MRRSFHRALGGRQLSCGRLLALWLCLGPAAGGFAVETTLLDDMVLRNWDLDDGLPSARINAVARTPDGYLWLATQRGLVRFDGTRFVVFDTSNTPGMEDSRTSCLLLDKHGDLYAGTYGRTLLKREGQVFRAQDLRIAAAAPRVVGMARGKANDLATALDISYDTVHNHIRHIYEKLHVRSRTQAVTKYLDSVHPPAVAAPSSAGEQSSIPRSAGRG